MMPFNQRFSNIPGFGHALSALILTLLMTVCAASAMEFVTIDPRLEGVGGESPSSSGAEPVAPGDDTGTESSIPGSSAQDSDSSTDPRSTPGDSGSAETATSAPAGLLRIPRSYLEGRCLFWVSIAGSTDNFMDMGSNADPVLVRLKLLGDRLVIEREFGALYSPDPGTPLEILVSYPVEERENELLVDVSAAVTYGTTLLGSPLQLSSREGILNSQDTGKERVRFTVLYQMANSRGDRFLTLALRFFLMKAPERSMPPKVEDPAESSTYGFFTTNQPKIDENGLTEQRKILNRWNLDQKIRYVLHPSIPARYLETVQEGILVWNDVFEAVRGIRPIEVEVGTDPNLLPGEPGVVVVYWYDREIPGASGAFAPSLTDPRNGEIFGGGIILFGGDIRKNMEKMKKKSPMEARAVASDESPRDDGSVILPGGSGMTVKRKTCRDPAATERLATQIYVDVSQSDIDELMRRNLLDYLPHEVGHTLGLTHNFLGSTDTARFNVGDTSTSIMDYLLDLHGQTRPGSYDTSAIAYGYDGDKNHWSNKQYSYSDSSSIPAESSAFDDGDPLDFRLGWVKLLRRLRVRTGYFKGFWGKDAYFESKVAYEKAFSTGLKKVRVFIDSSMSDERGTRAFEFFIKELTREASEPLASDSAPESKAEDDEGDKKEALLKESAKVLGRERLLVLRSLIATDTDGLPVVGLTSGQKGILSGVLAYQIEDRDESKDMRLSALDGLVTLRDHRAYQALEKIRDYLKEQRVDPENDESPDGELVTRIERAIAEYY